MKYKSKRCNLNVYLPYLQMTILERYCQLTRWDPVRRFTYPCRVFFTISPWLICEGRALFPRNDCDSSFSVEGGSRRCRTQVAMEEKRCMVNSRGIISSTTMAIMKEATMTVMAEPVVMASERMDEWWGCSSFWNWEAALQGKKLALMTPLFLGFASSWQHAVGRTHCTMR